MGGGAGNACRLFTLKKTSKITESNRQPIPTTATNHVFKCRKIGTSRPGNLEPCGHPRASTSGHPKGHRGASWAPNTAKHKRAIPICAPRPGHRGPKRGHGAAAPKIPRRAARSGRQGAPHRAGQYRARPRGAVPAAPSRGRHTAGRTAGRARGAAARPAPPRCPPPRSAPAAAAARCGGGGGGADKGAAVPGRGGEKGGDGRRGGGMRRRRRRAAWRRRAARRGGGC